MKALGYSLDNLSLMALTLAVGFVVDDAIVVLENIVRDRKSTRLNSSHTEIYTLSLHDALPIYEGARVLARQPVADGAHARGGLRRRRRDRRAREHRPRSEEHTSELQSHRDLHSFPTRRSSDL